MKGSIMKYEAQINASSSVLVTVPSTIPYGQQIMAPGPYMQGMAYPPKMYSTNNKNQVISSMREGGRRGGGRKNKNYNRNINHANEMQNKFKTSSETNVITTVIVNNNVDENLTANSNSNDNTFDFKIEQRIVTKINQNGKGVKKNNVSCVNIKSSIEVRQYGNDNKEYDDNVLQGKTPIASTTSRPVVKIIEEVSQSREIKDAPKVHSKSETQMQEVPDNAPMPTSTLSEPPAQPKKITWASLLRGSEPQVSSTNRPVAFIAPNNATNINSCQTKKTTKNYQSGLAENISQKNETSMIQRKPLYAEVHQIHFDDPNTRKMGEFLRSYRMDKQTVSLLPRGLINRSNYCYTNSILQALLACPPFYNLLLALPRSKDSSRRSPSPLIENMIKFAREFTPLSQGARYARKDRAHKRNEDAIVNIQSGVSFEPSYVYTMLKNTSSSGMFSIEGRQEDAEEFLSCVLNGISDEMFELMKLSSNNEQKPIDYTDANATNKGSITRGTDFGRTPLSDIFRGQLRSRVYRATEQPTDCVQPFFTLQLDLQKAQSIKTALDILVRKDQLEGMTCSKTKQQIEAWKQVTLEELPVILILHLKWFVYRPHGCSKILKTVDYPLDLKIDSSKLSENLRAKSSQKQRQYKLFAVTYHDGKEATKGHYFTDAYHVGYGGWIRYDDSSVKGVSEANVLKPRSPRVPYLLYYRRCDTIGNNQTNNNVKAR